MKGASTHQGTSPVPATPSTLTEELPPFPPKRFLALDVLRGIAVLGILPVNIGSFAGPDPWTYPPQTYAHYSTIDHVVEAGVDVLVSFKFMTLFSLMFGAGLLLMSERNEQRGRPVYVSYYRRMVGLAMLGLAHAWLIWYGDILFTYAVCGSLVFVMRKRSVRALLLTAGVLFGICLLLTSLCGLALLLFARFDPAGYEQAFAFSRDAVQRDIAAYTGSYLQQMSVRISQAIRIESFMLFYWSLWWVSGLMLTGIAYYKLGWITGEAKPAAYRRIALATLPIALPLSVLLFALRWTGSLSTMGMMTWLMAPLGLAALVVSTGYLALIMLWVQRGTLPWLRHSLAAVGRTALTCYLTQSLICTFIFYGHGVGLYAQLGRTEQMGVVLAVWVVQLTVAPLWLRWFTQGPFEWVWRRFTYLDSAPLRRQTSLA